MHTQYSSESHRCLRILHAFQYQCPPSYVGYDNKDLFASFLICAFLWAILDLIFVLSGFPSYNNGINIICSVIYCMKFLYISDRFELIVTISLNSSCQSSLLSCYSFYHDFFLRYTYFFIL